MSTVKLEGVAKRYGETRGVSDLTLECRDGEFVVIFGRPGAGKTTTLNLVAGIEDVTSGKVYIGERLVNDLPPQKRNVAMAFESYALYPHWSVRNNLEFPLRAPGRQLSTDERAARIKRVAELLEISHLLDRRPRQLSGGQRQRVSLGRALVRPSNVTLLDEPIAHLDARLRHSLRGELKRYQRENGTTTLYTTPDYVEAFGIADRVVVLIDGRVRQFASPGDVYDKPADVDVAKMVGDPPMNIFPLADSSSRISLGGTQIPLPGLQNGTKYIGIQPTDINLSSSTVKGAIPGKVYVAEPMGYDQVVRVEVDKHIVHAKASLEDGAYHIGQRVWLSPDWRRSHLFDVDGKRLEEGQR
jgi:multiple sugar transport system ATP-binding protein